MKRSRIHASAHAVATDTSIVHASAHAVATDTSMFANIIAMFTAFPDGLRVLKSNFTVFLTNMLIFSLILSSSQANQRYNENMSNETQPVRIETGEEVAFELMKFIAEKENKQLAQEEVRDYYLDLFVECASVVYDGERATDE